MHQLRGSCVSSKFKHLSFARYLRLSAFDSMVLMLVMLLPLVAAVQRQNPSHQTRGRMEIRQVREGGGLDHSPETFPNYVPVPDADESRQVIKADFFFVNFCQLL